MVGPTIDTYLKGNRAHHDTYWGEIGVMVATTMTNRCHGGRQIAVMLAPDRCHVGPEVAVMFGPK